ncbi:uncharacterized protein FIBRA_04137 [Fibroporia radiculosa]|uniref:Uncharacterized protein n=1 Tax=Fibroporia radiculosa TaxID=599839 RepID=J4IA03_9APHY|nr:uncharacterized protein FIBRA_04137 [Fibroporia radiculosa]CCM02061.1 predicted protein [Fibroporia radiculosa]
MSSQSFARLETLPGRLLHQRGTESTTARDDEPGTVDRRSDHTVGIRVRVDDDAGEDRALGAPFGKFPLADSAWSAPVRGDLPAGDQGPDALGDGQDAPSVVARKDVDAGDPRPDAGRKVDHLPRLCVGVLPEAPDAQRAQDGPLELGRGHGLEAAVGERDPSVQNLADVGTVPDHAGATKHEHAPGGLPPGHCGRGGGKQRRTHLPQSQDGGHREEAEDDDQRIIVHSAERHHSGAIHAEEKGGGVLYGMGAAGSTSRAAADEGE